MDVEKITFSGSLSGILKRGGMKNIKPMMSDSVFRRPVIKEAGEMIKSFYCPPHNINSENGVFLSEYENGLKDAYDERFVCLQNIFQTSHDIDIFYTTPREQLLSIQLLSWIKESKFDSNRIISLVHIPSEIKLFSADDSSGSYFYDKKQVVNEDMWGLACDTWDAFTSTTPEKFYGLLDRDLSPLLMLKNTILKTLQDLPSVFNGMSLSEQSIVNSIAGDDYPLPHLLGNVSYKTDMNTFHYPFPGHEMCQIIDDLIPSIVSGNLHGKKASEICYHPDMYQSPNRPSVSLTDDGASVVKGEKDFLDVGTLNRYWGGTLLTNENCWRWDDVNRLLLAPNEC